MLKLLLILPFFLTALHAQNLNAEAIIAKMINAYGGEKALQQLNSYEQVWRVEAKANDINGTDNRFVTMPSSLTTALTYPNKRETRILHNNYGIKKYGERTMEAKGPMLDAMKLQLMRLYSPLVMQSKQQDITVSSAPEHYVLTLAQGSISAAYFVSTKSYFIEKVVGRLSMGSQAMEFLTVYEEYKPFGGVMMPHKEIKYAGGVNTADMYLQQTTFTTVPWIRH